MSLLEVKKKITGVQNTRKITKAMQLVAASKMKSFQKLAVSSREYAFDLLSILQNNISEDFSGTYSETRETGKTLFVLYTSDKGLCGPLNNKITQSLLNSEKWKSTPMNSRLLITIGKKSEQFALNNKIPTAKAYKGIPEKITDYDSIKIINGIIEYWTSREVKEVVLIAPHYKNSFTFYPILKTFLPLSPESIKSTIGPTDSNEKVTKQKISNSYMIFTPSREVVGANLELQVIQASFIQAFLELKAAEYSSRMIAMQNATDAADKITVELKKQYNKARQQNITQEIAELIGASLAINE
ncbi:ATP synthase F1 subunit gamma [Candidatus Peregrinibacteria bacterium HGW-Peregrinibacteria-1]|nr:MAG: ATP synthase F1 subunit gamma [Candidatus Peregrinibacteria bacterium HGW-Peregrinibacteria-1]